MSEQREVRKRRAARRASEAVSAGEVVGLGSGSTAAHAIRSLGERVAEGLDIVGVPSSYQAADVARAAGVPVRAPADVAGIDVAIDGADQVAGGDLIKGGGGAHTREKAIDAAADRFLVVVDDSKLADALDLAVPLEVLPDARPLVADRLRALDGEPTVRRVGGDAPALTDNGNHLIDCDFGRIEDVAGLADALAAVPGVVDHGLFVGLADAIYVGDADGVSVRSP